MYQGYINRPPSELEIFCGVYSEGLTDEIMKEPLGKLYLMNANRSYLDNKIYLLVRCNV